MASAVVEADAFDTHPFVRLVRATVARDEALVAHLLADPNAALNAAPHPLPPLTPPLVEAAALGDAGLVSLLRAAGADAAAVDVASTHRLAFDLCLTTNRSYAITMRSWTPLTPLGIARKSARAAAVAFAAAENGAWSVAMPCRSPRARAAPKAV